MADANLNENMKISYNSSTAFETEAFTSFVEIINSFVISKGVKIVSKACNDTQISCNYKELVTDEIIVECLRAIRRGSTSIFKLESSWGITFAGSPSLLQIVINKEKFTTARNMMVAQTPRQHGGARNSVAKNQYANSTIKKYYDNEKIKNVEKTLQEIWDSYNDGEWKTEALRSEIFRNLFSKFDDSNLIDCGEIVSSLKVFIDEITSYLLAIRKQLISLL